MEERKQESKAQRLIWRGGPASQGISVRGRPGSRARTKGETTCRSLGVKLQWGYASVGFGLSTLGHLI